MGNPPRIGLALAGGGPLGAVVGRSPNEAAVYALSHLRRRSAAGVQAPAARRAVTV